MMCYCAIDFSKHTVNWFLLDSYFQQIYLAPLLNNKNLKELLAPSKYPNLRTVDKIPVLTLTNVIFAKINMAFNRTFNYTLLVSQKILLIGLSFISPTDLFWLIYEIFFPNLHLYPVVHPKVLFWDQFCF